MRAVFQVLDGVVVLEVLDLEKNRHTASTWGVTQERGRRK
jgi:activator of HSP90 ATPase